MTKFLFLILLFTSFYTSKAQDVYLDRDNNMIQVFDDNTWSYYSTIPDSSYTNYYKPAKSTHKYYSHWKKYAIWVNDSSWTLTNHDIIAKNFIEMKFQHRNSQIIAEIGFQESKMNIDSVVLITDRNMKNSGNDYGVIEQSTIVINGTAVILVKIKALLNNKPIIFQNCYYTGKNGTVQILTYVHEQLYETHKDKMMDFISGLILIKSPKEK